MENLIEINSSQYSCELILIGAHKYYNKTSAKRQKHKTGCVRITIILVLVF